MYNFIQLMIGRFDRHSADNRYSMEWKCGPAENAQWDNHLDITSIRQHNMKIGQQAFWWWSVLNKINCQLLTPGGLVAR